MGRLIISKQLEKAVGQYYTVESDVNGDLQFVTSASLVAANETVTSVTDNADGTFTFTDEAAADTTVNIPGEAVMSQTDGTGAWGGAKYIVPLIHNGKGVDNFYAYFETGSGTHTIDFYINGVSKKSITSLTAGSGGAIAVTGVTLTTGDLIEVGFSTSVGATYSVCHGSIAFT